VVEKKSGCGYCAVTLPMLRLGAIAQAATATIRKALPRLEAEEKPTQKQKGSPLTISYHPTLGEE